MFSRSSCNIQQQRTCLPDSDWHWLLANRGKLKPLLCEPSPRFIMTAEAFEASQSIIMLALACGGCNYWGNHPGFCPSAVLVPFPRIFETSFIDPFIQKIRRQRTGALRYNFYNIVDKHFSCVSIQFFICLFSCVWQLTMLVYYYYLCGQATLIDTLPFICI